MLWGLPSPQIAYLFKDVHWARFSEGSHRWPSSSDSDELSDELFSFVVCSSPAPVSWLVAACLPGSAGSSCTLNFMSSGISPPKLVSRRKIMPASLNLKPHALMLEASEPDTGKPAGAPPSLERAKFRNE